MRGPRKTGGGRPSARVDRSPSLYTCPLIRKLMCVLENRTTIIAVVCFGRWRAIATGDRADRLATSPHRERLRRDLEFWGSTLFPKRMDIKKNRGRYSVRVHIRCIRPSFPLFSSPRFSVSGVIQLRGVIRSRIFVASFSESFTPLSLTFSTLCIFNGN